MVGGELVVQRLSVVGAHPQRDAEPGLSGVEVGAGQRVAVSLTPVGVERLTGASRAVARVEEQMLATFSASHRHRLQADLGALADNLTHHAPSAGRAV